MKRFLVAMAPGLAVSVLAALLYWGAPDSLDWLAGTYGVVVYAAGMILSWIFHRSRAFIVLLLVAALDVVVVGGAPVGRISEFTEGLLIEPSSRPLVTLAMGTTVVALVGFFALFRDRGVGSRIGLLQLLAAVSTTGVAVLFALDEERMASLATHPEVEPLTQMTLLGLPRITTFVALVSAAALAYVLQRYRGPIERGLAWTAVFLLVALLDGVALEHASLFLLAAGLTLTLSVVETSYVMAYRDELTGLPGRRALMQYLDGLEGTYTVAMVDVDHFKMFNDRHGHDVGDQVLKLVASHLGKAPGGGKAYRYGGEEFTLLYPGRVQKDALPHLEEVRAAVEGARFTLRSWRRPRKKPDAKKAQSKKAAKAAKKKAKGGAKKKAKAASKKKARSPRKLSVTVSIGIADNAKDAAAASEVLKRADKALYRAKKAGRNQVSS